MKLFIVPTPIGNLQDMTYRAVDTLKNVDTILCEDTRKTVVLLKHYNIKKHLESFHKFNEHKKLKDVINRLKAGEKMALVSDAGTPGISDPGFLIIREAIENDIEIETLPGASAFIPAIVNSGLPCDRFYFEGFLPQKKGRQKRLLELTEVKHTLIFYESPYRISKTLGDFIKYFGEERKASISREISKIYEETIRGSLNELLDISNKRKLKGEFVIIVQGKLDDKKKKEKE
ncbi:MAG: 16S rRNA (cytidine(1402)-2'-O)-methyltransferase [Bacteroidota bacterium]|nr:16S rRNA (cytidine(1402)-2'-O)-methyltransferase [Bacteroidota bacterium]